MTYPSLTIIIVNWNAGLQLKRCLNSIMLADKDGFMLSEVIVIDNGSKDDSLSGIDLLSIPVKVILNNSNHGFAAACNQGAKIAIGNYFLFLNPDMQLFENSLSVPIYFMQRNENAEV